MIYVLDVAISIEGFAVAQCRAENSLSVETVSREVYQLVTPFSGTEQSLIVYIDPQYISLLSQLDS